MAGTPYLAIMLFGTEEPSAEIRLLKAGPLSAELDAGNLRYIRHDGREAIRAIACVVRDRYRGTFNPGTGAGGGAATKTLRPCSSCTSSPRTKTTCPRPAGSMASTSSTSASRRVNCPSTSISTTFHCQATWDAPRSSTFPTMTWPLSGPASTSPGDPSYGKANSTSARGCGEPSRTRESDRRRFTLSVVPGAVDPGGRQDR